MIKAAGFSTLYYTGELNFNSFVPCGFARGGEHCLRHCLPNSKQSVSKTGDINRLLKRLEEITEGQKMRAFVVSLLLWNLASLAASIGESVS